MEHLHSMNDSRAMSHRNGAFVADFQKTRELLCGLVKATQVEIMMGTGTLANDAIAGQLALLCKPGLVLVSGEFGRRLACNANGAKLYFHTLEIPEGQTFERGQLERALKEHPDIGWIWGTHCETSTGVLNDLEVYKQICNEHGIRLCLDCISSIGAVPVDLSGVFLASGTSGKSLAASTGLSFVFHNHDLVPAPDELPCSLDLGIYQTCQGIPYTIPPHLVYTLLSALKSHDWEKRYEELRGWSATIRRRLAEIDVPILAPDFCAMPTVVTIALPPLHSSEAIGNSLQKHGVHISYRNNYLVERNWIQASIIGSENKPAEKFVRLLREELSR